MHLVITRFRDPTAVVLARAVCCHGPRPRRSPCGPARSRARARTSLSLLLRAKELPHGVAAIGNRQAARFLRGGETRSGRKAREDQHQDGNNKEALSLRGFGDSAICGACRRRRRRSLVGENRTARTRRSGKKGEGRRR